MGRPFGGSDVFDPGRGSAVAADPGGAVTRGVADDDADGIRVGVFGSSLHNNGVHARSLRGVGLYATGPELAARLDGHAEITGRLRVDTIDCVTDLFMVNADCAEDFDVEDAAAADPGTVVVLGGNGRVRTSADAYDKRVVGVVSGAGTYRPAIVLDRRPPDAAATGARRPVALMGKVWCKVDARWSAVEPGDLLTTSPTPGHAMRADDPARAFGAVVGKALGSLAAGAAALVPVLVALQ